MSSSLTNQPAELHSAAPSVNRQISPPLDLGLPYWFHLFFPDRALTTNLSILVIGCDDDLAVRLARANPHARILAIEQRPATRAATEQASKQHHLTNLELTAAWPDAEAGERFDLVYYNQPSWPAEPAQTVLSRAAALLQPEGSLHLTVRAKYAWKGVDVVRELLDTLGVRPDAEGYPRARQIVAALGQDHPWNLLAPWNLLGPDPEMRPDDLLADWLGTSGPCFSVPELYELLAASGLTLQRFTYQPYYLPQCSPLARSPLAGDVRRLPAERQHALMEAYWPGIRYHLAVACRADRPPESFRIEFHSGDWLLYAPLLPAKLPVEQDDSPIGGKARLCWRAAGMPELSVSLGGFQHRLLQALDRAEELGEVVGLAGISGDPQLRDAWARDFFQMMSDFDFLHFRICHSTRQPSLLDETGPGQAEPAEAEQDEAEPGEAELNEPQPRPQPNWAELAELSERQRQAQPAPEPYEAIGAYEEGRESQLLEGHAAREEPEPRGGQEGPAANLEIGLEEGFDAPDLADELATPVAERELLFSPPQPPSGPASPLALDGDSAAAAQVSGLAAEIEANAATEAPSLEQAPAAEFEASSLDVQAPWVELQAGAPQTEAATEQINASPIATSPVAAASSAQAIETAPAQQPPGVAAALFAPSEVSAIELERIPYEACPLCTEPGYGPYLQVKTELLLEAQTVRTTMPWVRCGRCSHVFTSGYFAGDTCARGLKGSLRWRSSLRRAVASRSEASRVVAAITTLRESAAGRWLDVGCSYSGIVAVAAEFGYDSAGVECCTEAADRFSNLGYAVVAGSLFDCNEGPFDVVSFSGAVDSMPFPVQALSHANRLLAPRGLIYICAPTSDSLLWRKLNAEDANPHWARLERYHVFNRKTLFHLLQTAGFEPCSYGASGSDGVGMEVIGCKR